MRYSNEVHVPAQAGGWRVYRAISKLNVVLAAIADSTPRPTMFALFIVVPLILGSDMQGIRLQD
jgi:hypothetical protein